MDIVELVNQFGLPVVVAGGLGYFIFFIWKFVTTKIKYFFLELKNIYKKNK